MSTTRALLVTGGLGFIGSHVARLASERGRRVIVLDDLSGSGGEPPSLPEAIPIVIGCIGDVALVKRIVLAHEIGGVIHCAGKETNLVKSLRLIDTVRELGVRSFVFSSTAAINGAPPLPPYALSKLCVEQALEAAGVAHGLRWVALRRVNVAGAHRGGILAERHDPETHLIPLAIDAALGRRPPLLLHGIDQPTPDGTCIRDYVHVEDLAVAYLLALEALEAGQVIGSLDLGTGRGYSVREVIEAVGAVLGRPVPHVIGGRRNGDPSHLVVDPRRAMSVLGWSIQWPRLTTMIEDALRACRRRAAPPGPGIEATSEQWICPDADNPGWDAVDQASWESFPASDSPAT